MGKTSWTKEQEEAIYTRNCNLLVAAAAGSGKTAVLVERIIKIITNEEEPIDIDKLLVATFTNAAAAEMRERIAEAISKELNDKPDSQLLQRQLTLLNKASITTIHSFCLEVIKGNFHLVDLDPNFRIGDETENVLLKTEALEDLFEEVYKKENLTEGFINLIEGYSSNKDDEAIQNMVLKLHSFAMSCPFPKLWLIEAAEAFNVSEDFTFGASKWAEVLMNSINIELSGVKKSIDHALGIIDLEESLLPYRENFIEDLYMVEDLLKYSNNSWKNLSEEFSQVNFKTLKRCGKDVDKEKQEIVKKIRDKVKDSINSIRSEIFSFEDNEIKEDMKEIYPIVSCLSKLVLDFDKKYKDKKKKKGIIDFNDIEHLCLKILTIIDKNGEIKPSEVALTLREKYDEVLVDEYQDSNMVQETILSMVSRKDTNNPNMFMVGDVKQSIYRFRQAKPELFLEKYNTYSDEEGEKSRRIMLYKNFRSRKEILDGSNYVFKQIMSENIGELDYDDNEALNLGADYIECTDENSKTGGEIELHLIEKTSAEITESFEEDEEKNAEGLEDDEDIDNIKLEARMAAKRIVQLMKEDNDGRYFKIFDKNTKEYRKVQYKDIVILLRATSNWAPTFVEEFKSFNIPVYADTGTGYFQTAEIQTVMSLLQIIDNPRQDIPLIAVLRSPIAAFTPEELIEIKVNFKGITYYDALKLAGESYLSEKEHNCEDELSKKCHKFLERLHKWRDKALYMTIENFIWYLYTDTGYYGYVGALVGGVQRQANLKVLFQRAEQYSKTSFKGLFNFVNFINKLRISSGDMGSAKTLGENEDVVRIMSIHKSKGLEFPVVMLCGTGKNFNLRDINSNFLIHYELGYGPDYVNYERRLSYATILKQALRKKIKLESLSEEMRILYVAFTRAKEKLIITGTARDLEKSISKWALDASNIDIKLSENVIIKGKGYLDWIIPSVIRHKSLNEFRNNHSIKINDKALLEDESKWSLKLWKREAVVELKENDERTSLEEVNPQELDFSETSNKYYEIINKKLSFEYAYKEASKLPAKISVTELKRQLNQEDEYSAKIYDEVILKKPAFLEEEKVLTSVEKGTALHSAVQHMNLNIEFNIENIKSQINKMVIDEILTDKQSRSINIEGLVKFFTSSLGRRIINSGNAKREVPFQIKLKSTDIYKELEEKKYQDEIIMVQGAIDCYFEEDGEIILVDYKTDYVDSSNIDEKVNIYKTQIQYYSEALKRITGKNVKEKYLYFFYNGSAVKL